VLLPLQLAQEGWKCLQIGLLFYAWGFVTLLAQPLIGAWSDRHGPQAPIRTSLLAATLLVPLIFKTVDSPWLWLIFLGTGIALTTALIPTMLLLAQGLAEKQAGQAFALYNVAFSVGIVCGPWLGGYMTERFDAVRIAPVGRPLGSNGAVFATLAGAESASYRSTVVRRCCASYFFSSQYKTSSRRRARLSAVATCYLDERLYDGARAFPDTMVA
jgi:predicted MFS family arabinose efflux permease